MELVNKKAIVLEKYSKNKIVFLDSIIGCQKSVSLSKGNGVLTKAFNFVVVFKDTNDETNHLNVTEEEYEYVEKLLIDKMQGK